MIRSSQHSSNLQASSWRTAVRGLVVCLGVVVVLLGGGSKAWGQCAAINDPYGTATAPASGVTTTVTTAQYMGEFNTISSVAANTAYVSSNTTAGCYITVRISAYNGTVIAAGNSPLSWVSTTAGTYFVQYNTSGCGINSTNSTSTLSSPCTKDFILNAAMGTGGNWEGATVPTNASDVGIFSTATSLTLSAAQPWRSGNVTNGKSYVIGNGGATNRVLTLGNATTFTNCVSNVSNDLFYLSNNSNLTI
ncbi:MAG: hypothetical protein ACK44B_09975, partial [Flavobacteriales bacterium]